MKVFSKNWVIDFINLASISAKRVVTLAVITATTLISTTAQSTDTAQLTIQQAEEFLQQKQPGEAVKVIRATLLKEPGNAMLNFRLGKILHNQGKYQDAVNALSLSVNKLPKTGVEYREAVQMLGLSHYVLGHLAESIPYFEQTITWESENQEIIYALGISYIQTRQPIKSRGIYARLFGVPAGSAAAYVLNGQMHIRQRFEETADVELSHALKLDPRTPQANFLLGELAIYKAEIDKGIAYMRKELEINPSNGMAYYRLGEALTRQLKWDEAVIPLQKSIWLNPFFSGPYIVLGKVYLKKSDFGNAESMLRRAIGMDPNNFGAHYLLAQTLQQAGKLDGAKAEFALAEKLRSNSEKQP